MRWVLELLCTPKHVKLPESFLHDDISGLHRLWIIGNIIDTVGWGDRTIRPSRPTVQTSRPDWGVSGTLASPHAVYGSLLFEGNSAPYA
jgi:hypothetical protein